MASYILDTHTILWYFDRSKNLPGKVFQVILNPENQIFVSICSYWEMTIKSGLGKLVLPDTIENMISNAEKSLIETLPISPKDLTTLDGLPMHHRDPFDRLLISQAINHQFPVLTKDPLFGRYPIAINLVMF